MIRRASALLPLLVVCIRSAASQGSSGIEMAAGVAEKFGPSASIAYFHPLPLKQFYALAGVSACHEYSTSIPVTANRLTSWTASHATTLQSVYLGIQAGDYIFLIPRISHNILGNRTSFGYGVKGGLLIHPGRLIAFGFGLSYDRLRAKQESDPEKPVEINGMEIVIRIKFDS